MTRELCGCDETVALRAEVAHLTNVCETWGGELHDARGAVHAAKVQHGKDQHALERLRALRSKLATEVELYEAHVSSEDRYGIRNSTGVVTTLRAELVIARRVIANQRMELYRKNASEDRAARYWMIEHRKVSEQLAAARAEIERLNSGGSK